MAGASTTNRKKKAPLTRASVKHPELSDGEKTRGKMGIKIPVHFKRWLERAQLLGLQTRQLVWELHVVQGKSKEETAFLLDISKTRVHQLFAELKDEVTAQAPKKPEDFEFMRQQLFAKISAVMTAAETFPGDPRMLAVRLKAIDQIADLYGLDMERKGEVDTGQKSYSTPEEIADDVQNLAFNVYGRGKDIAEARAALEQPRDVTPAQKE